MRNNLRIISNSKELWKDKQERKTNSDVDWLNFERAKYEPKSRRAMSKSECYP